MGSICSCSEQLFLPLLQQGSAGVGCRRSRGWFGAGAIPGRRCSPSSARQNAALPSPCAARGLRLLPPHSRVFPVAQAGAGDRFPSAAALAEEPRQRSRSEPEQLKAPAADGRCRLSPRHRLLALPLLNLSPDSSDSPLLLTYPPPQDFPAEQDPHILLRPQPLFPAGARCKAGASAAELRN